MGDVNWPTCWRSSLNDGFRALRRECRHQPGGFVRRCREPRHAELHDELSQQNPVLADEFHASLVNSALYLNLGGGALPLVHITLPDPVLGPTNWWLTKIRTLEMVTLGTKREAKGSYLIFERARWAALRASTPLSLADTDLATLRGLNETTSLAEVEEIYLPLSRLLNLHVQAARGLAAVQDVP